MGFYKRSLFKFIKMKRRRKIIIFGIVVIVIIVAFGYYMSQNVHHIITNDQGRYIWVFKDSAQENVDKNLRFGVEGKNDILCSFVYKKKYYINIWEFKDLCSLKLNDISINQNVNLDKVDVSAGEVFYEDTEPNPTVTVRYGFDFNGCLNVNINKESDVVKMMDSTYYKGFYGNLNRLTLSDCSGDHLIIFDYKSEKVPTLFLLCKKEESFFVLRLNADEKFDESIISIFNL